MIVLDTNVISELFKPHPNVQVTTWLAALTGEVSITAITQAELLAGVERLPQGARKSQLATRITQSLEPYRRTRAILAFDDLAAEQYAKVVRLRQQAGLPISTGDAQIAAICRANHATCATRNVKDFEQTGIEIINPWAAVD